MPGSDPVEPEGCPADPQLTVAPGVSLRYRVVRASSYRHTVVLLPGRAEFIERHDEPIARLVAYGCDVFALDWRGQGASSRALADPRKGHIVDFDSYLSDLVTFLERVVAPADRGATAPIALAHSMGAHLALRLASEHPGRVSALALSAPFLEIAPPAMRLVYRALAAAFGVLGMSMRYAPGTGPVDRRRERFPGNPFTTDPSRFERTRAAMRAFPACCVGGPTAAWVGAAMRSLGVIHAPGYLTRVTVPVLAVLAGADRIVSSPGARKLLDTIPEARVLTLRGCRHEILNEADAFQAEFWRNFRDLLG